MTQQSLNSFLNLNRDRLKCGPVAVIFAEDMVEVASTIDHATAGGFAHVLVLGRQNNLPALPMDHVFPIVHDVHAQGAIVSAMNAIIKALPGIWIYWGYNAEYLFHPFGEGRDISEMLAFHTEERREAVLTCVIDLYAPDLAQYPDGVDRDTAMFDRMGYYALRRFNGGDSAPADRQFDIFGGLRWRFEQHVPVRSRRIDRIGLFRAKPGLEMRANFTFNDEEMNTYACPWHHNLSAAVMSFRAAKALRHNPGSRAQINDFNWAGSTRFDWNSQQLMDHGFMEPGQWF